MSHGLTGNRENWWEWFLLDRQDNRVRELEGVVVGSSRLDLNVNSPTRLSGEVTWVGRHSQMPNWDEYRLQPWQVEKDSATGRTHQEPLGVLLPTVPSVRFGDHGQVEATIELYDKTLILREDEIPTDLAYPVGTDPIVAVREQINFAMGPAGTAIQIEPTSERLRTPLFWEVGTSRYRIINDLLSAVGYFGIWVDYQGRFRSSPYVNPADRPIEWHFHSGVESIYTPDHTNEHDTFKVPNQVICLTQGDEDTPGLVSVVTDEDPNSPYSYQRRGRWISRTYEGVEATSQEVLDNIAAQRMATAQRTAASLTLTHAPVALYGHDLVHFMRATLEGEKEFLGTVQTMSMKDTGLWTTRLREAIPGGEDSGE